MTPGLHQAGLETGFEYDSVGRRAGLTLRDLGGGAERYRATYRYDAAGRLGVVSNAGWTASYGYGPDGGTVSDLTYRTGGVETVRGVWERDGFGLVTNLTWTAGGRVADAFAYQCNAVGQRTRCARSDGTTWEYGYDGLDQLKTAGQTGSNGVALAGREYVYDTIGNRRTVTADGTNATYGANALNQYTQIRSSAAARRGGQGTVIIVAGKGWAPPPDVSTTVELQYDSDGNLIRDGQWTYAWDAENRLVLASNATMVVSNVYDYMSRRVSKAVFDNSSVLIQHSTFLYDGWNLISESAVCGLWTNVSRYVWGLDLSGTPQGAGGIGGLLFSFIHQPSTINHFLYDANGNVSAVMSLGSGGPSTISDYSYDPFGNLLSGRNPVPSSFLFSTKYLDSETGLYYYGYRHYSPSRGRWLSRDPLEEAGGRNLYGFVGNSAISGADALGLYLVAFDGTGNYKGRTPATNVERLWRSYLRGKNYYPGVGSRWWSKMSGGLHGLGGEVRVENAWRDLVEHYKNMTDDEVAKDPVDIIGFSRGAALARHFANVIYQRGDPRQYQREVMSYQHQSRRWTVAQEERISGCPMPIRFLGIFDTVASFGIPGNRRNIGFDLSIPPNVQNVRHAISRDESRSLFPLTRIKSTATRVERMFPGVHSDVGGGYADNKDIQYGPLLWMWQEGKDVGVPWDKPVELEGWTPPSGMLMGHQSDVPFWQDHATFEWAPVGPGDKLKRPDSWEE